MTDYDGEKFSGLVISTKMMITDMSSVSDTTLPHLRISDQYFPVSLNYPLCKCRE